MDEREKDDFLRLSKGQWVGYLLRLVRLMLMGGFLVGIYSAAAWCFRFAARDSHVILSFGKTMVAVELEDRTISVGCLLLFVLVLNTVLGKSALFDETEKARFLAEYGTIKEFSTGEGFRVALHSRAFWSGFVWMSALVVLLSSSVFGDIAKAILGKTGPKGISATLIGGAVAVPLIFGLNLFAYLSAHKCWIEDGRIRQGDSAPILRLVKWMVMAFVCYCAAFFLIPLLLPTIASFLQIFAFLKVWQIIPLIMGIVLALVVLIYIRALLHRRRFIKRIKTLCREAHFELSRIKEPYLSVFRESREENFTVSANGRIYACKLLSGVKRSNAMTLSADGRCTHTFSFCIRKVEFFRVENTSRYDFESKYRKLLVVTPVPKKLFLSEDGRVGEADNGDIIGEYKIFSGGALLRAMERNSLD